MMPEDSVSFLPNAPFSQRQREWLAGYFAGLNARAFAEKKDASEPSDAAAELLILFGTQTGNAEGVARDVAVQAEAVGLKATVKDMAETQLTELPIRERILIVTSTYGEGDQPDNAQGLWDQIIAPTAPRLESSFFSVLALGDTSYEYFCQAGKDWDLRLEQLGAKRVFKRYDCDLDFEEPAAEWTLGALKAIAAVGSPLPATNGAAPANEGPAMSTDVPSAPATPKYGKKNLFPSRELHRKLLTEGSSKETWHYELSLEGSGYDYLPGDVLYLQPTNCPELVGQIIGAVGADRETTVGTKAGEFPLHEALFSRLEIKTPSKNLVKAVAERSGDANLQAIVGDSKVLNDWLWGQDVIDLLLDYPQAKFDAGEFADLLKPLQPRAYSISSSFKAHPDEVHLTIASVRYETHGRPKKGVCSTWLADRVGEDSPLPCFLLPNKHFKLPASDVPIIMVGPGTGIAPFRAFLEEREILGDTGDNWLFFGERNRATDYFYADEFERWQQTGLLTRLDLAFSRDQENKIYVQTRMREHSRDLWDWLERGAVFYVCGDAFRMAKDVDTALHEMIAEHSGKGEEAAVEYVKQMKKDKRYLRDVY